MVDLDFTDCVLNQDVSHLQVKVILVVWMMLEIQHDISSDTSTAVHDTKA